MFDPPAVAKLLDKDGALSRLLPGFETRPQQLTLCTATAELLAAGGGLAAEAGTGTGKTIAYLLPAAIWARETGQRVLISTYTKILQNQIIERDAPLVARMLGDDLRIAAAYGQENYVCRFRLAHNVERGLFTSLNDACAAERLLVWAEATEDGLLLSYQGQLPAALAARVGRNAAACRREKCPYRPSCPYLLARKRWETSQILVANHALLFSSLAGDTDLLPDFSAVILDEAHRIEEAASWHFGTQVSLPLLLETINHLFSLRDILAGDRTLRDMTLKLQTAAAAARTTTETLTRSALDQFGPEQNRHRIDAALDTAECAGAATALAATAETAATSVDDELFAAELNVDAQRLKTAAAALQHFAEPPAPDSVRWLERTGRGVTLVSTPLSVAANLQEKLYQRMHATMLVSATLTVAGSFDFFSSRFGLAGFKTLQLDSPFDYSRQSILYVPRGLPPPSNPRFLTAAAAVLQKLLAVSRGRALVLFTSYDALNAIWELIPRQEYTYIKQGDEPPPSLLARFRADTHSVLFATQSFWQGIDVPGEALSCLVIVRLPFEVPDDPRLSAICDQLKSAGEEPFTSYQVPVAVLRFRQGFGRLIRSTQDRGAVVVLDRRLLERSYGETFLASLPTGLPLTRDFADLQRFFDSIDTGASPQTAG